MSKLILALGIASLTLGIVPPKQPQLKTVELRVHHVQHEACKFDACAIVDREFK